MNKLAKNSLHLLWWLGRFMHLWVRSTVFPPQLKVALNLDLSQPVVYVLRSRSLTDLLVLDQHCRREGLPRPEYNLWSLLGRQGGAYLYLTTAGLLQQKRGKLLPTALYRLVSEVSRRQDEVQLVPVSVFWGRNPGREEKSLFKFMFFDDENGGFLQRFFTFFLQGRNVFCNFGQPISLLKLIGEGLAPEETSKKLRRVLRIHFRSQRDIVLGPYIYNRRQVMAGLVKAPRVREVIENEAQKRNLPVERIEAQALKYADEVTSRFSHHVLRFLDIVLTWLWRRIYNGVEVKHGERLRELAQNYELVYMASHRSHMDYLLLGYVLYYLGLMPPHTVAGINLNFWPIGPLLRRGGAIFIRRTFRGNRLYSMVVSEFVHYLITTGFPIGFYPEGGRSRTGRLLKPKMGILTMVIQSYRRNPRKPIMLVPVYIGYDKVMEARSYRHELHGKSKKKESITDLFKLHKVLRSQLGKAYLGFGEPLELGTYLASVGMHVTLPTLPAVNEGSGEDDEEVAGKALAPVVAKLAKEIAIRTNEAAIVTPVALFATILLAAPKKALGEQDLIGIAERWLDVLVASNPGVATSLCVNRHDLVGELRYAEELAALARFAHPTGDVIYINKEDDSFVLNYYRNNTLHLFVRPALLAAFLPGDDEPLAATELCRRAYAMYSLLRDDFLLARQTATTGEGEGEEFFDCLQALVAAGIVGRAGGALDMVRRPEVTSVGYSAYKLLSQVIAPDVQRYALYTTLLAHQLEGGGSVKRAVFEEECQLMSQRLSILEGMTESPLYDGASFRNFIETLGGQSYLSTKGEDLLLIGDLPGLAERFKDVVSADVRQSLKRTPDLTGNLVGASERKSYGELENTKI